MDKESIYELQKIDCNCNDCAFMIRDNVLFNKWKEIQRQYQFKKFERDKANLLLIVEKCKDEVGKKELMRKYNKMQFQFNSAGLIHYGNCSKLNKQVTFIPTFMSTDDTFNCFVHRKDFNKNKEDNMTLHPQTFIGLKYDTITEVSGAIKEIKKLPKNKYITQSQIKEITLLIKEVFPDAFIKRRSNDILHHRQAIIYTLLTSNLNFTLKQVGDIFGLDHSTVIHSKRCVCCWITTEGYEDCLKILSDVKEKIRPILFSIA